LRQPDKRDRQQNNQGKQTVARSGWRTKQQDQLSIALNSQTKALKQAAAGLNSKYMLPLGQNADQKNAYQNAGY